MPEPISTAYNYYKNNSLDNSMVYGIMYIDSSGTVVLRNCDYDVMEIYGVDCIFGHYG